jgi:hypothetical protein
MRFVEVAFDLVHAGLERARRHRVDEGGDEIEQSTALVGRKLRRLDSLVRDDAVVAPGATQVEMVGRMPAAPYGFLARWITGSILRCLRRPRASVIWAAIL